MSWEIRQGDCIEAMRELDESSVDAVVCDPPYGLEFMGKEWDRLGDVGQASHQGFDTEGNFKGFKLASYNASANVKCRRCRKWRWDHEGRKCECEPIGDFPNVRADQGRRMGEWHHAWVTEALRILKPGGHLLAFGGTRTYHRLACAVEDAGFEIRDSVIWLYGSGFPKSLDVSKAIDKAAGAEREAARHDGFAPFGGPGSQVCSECGRTKGGAEGNCRCDKNGSPATPEAEQWQGWGTALKPAHEPIVVARKPLVGTVAQNVQAQGVGALNIDGCRVEGAPRTTHADGHRSTGSGEGYGMDAYEAEVPSGRWPPNVILDEEAAGMLDEQSGERPSGIAVTRHGGGRRIFNQPSDGKSEPDSGYTDAGGASRFFYCAKSSRSERDAGLSVANGKVCSCPTPEDQAPSPLRDTSGPTEEGDNDSSTTGNGSSTTGPSLTDSRSTISTGTRPTTGLKTSRSSAPSTTSESTPPTTDEQTTEAGSDGAESAAGGSPPTPSTTTSAEKVGPSTDAADPATSGESSARSSSAGSKTCPSCGGVIGGALRNAHPT